MENHDVNLLRATTEHLFCNDIEIMKSMIMKRFGFNIKKIIQLYNYVTLEHIS